MLNRVLIANRGEIALSQLGQAQPKTPLESLGDQQQERLRDILRESGLSTQAFYKHFRSKDELMLVLLDDGRRRLVGYLAHRMEKAGRPEQRIRAWIEGVLAQASDPEVAARTRPTAAETDHLVQFCLKGIGAPRPPT